MTGTGIPLSYEQVVLRNAESGPVSLDVPAHQTVAVLGNAASGVTRLGALALGLELPSEGRVLVFGEEIARLPRRAALARRRSVGYVPAGGGLLQNLSLEDNLALPLRFGSTLSEREIRSRLNLLLALVRIPDAGELRPAAANQEQRRRAALARALVFDPALLILEQPFDGLPGRVAAELLEVARGGETAEGARRTVFIACHDLPDRLLPRIDGRARLLRSGLVADT